MDLASNLQAIEDDLSTHYTGLGYLRYSHLHARFVHRKINSTLPKITEWIENEVDQGIDEFFNSPMTDNRNTFQAICVFTNIAAIQDEPMSHGLYGTIVDSKVVTVYTDGSDLNNGDQNAIFRMGA